MGEGGGDLPKGDVTPEAYSVKVAENPEDTKNTLHLHPLMASAEAEY